MLAPAAAKGTLQAHSPLFSDLRRLKAHPTPTIFGVHLVKAASCKPPPGTFVPVIDRNKCEGKAECERVCPVSVFAVQTLPAAMRVGLSLRGKVKGFVHRWQQAMLVNASRCEACGLCVSACPEGAITLART